MTPDLGKSLVKRANELKALRLVHEPVWRDMYQHSFPIRGDGFSEEQISATDAAARQSRLYDSTAPDSLTILASAILSGLTPANSRWFGVATDGADDIGKQWLDESAETVWENIHNSNYDAAAFECCLDVTVAGWFVLFIDTDRENGGYLFEQWHISTVFCAASKPGGVIDTFYRCYELTAEQCVNEFGEDALSQKVRDTAKKKPDEKIKLLQAIYPRKLSVPNAVRAKNLPFASVHVERDNSHVVRESGFHEQPCVAPRWMSIPRSVYGIGPMMNALPDIRTLNEIKRLELLNLDFAVNGMFIAEDDGVLNTRNLKIGPRKVIVANSVDSIKPLNPPGNFDVSFSKSEQLQAAIRKVLMADQLQPQDGPQMTAYEVSVRVQMIRQLLGPVYGRFQAEFLKLMVFRCFGLALRAGILGQPPDSVANQLARVTYMSPLARAQKLDEVNAIDQAFQFAGRIAQVTGETSAFDSLDTDGSMAAVAEGFGMPLRLLRTADDIAKLRQDRANAQKQAEQEQQQAGLVQAAGEAAAKRSAA